MLAASEERLAGAGVLSVMMTGGVDEDLAQVRVAQRLTESLARAIGSTHQAQKAEEQGVDVFIASGYEMGATRPPAR